MAENTTVRNQRTALEIMQMAAVKAAKKGDWGFLLNDTPTVVALFKGNDQLKMLVAKEVERQGFDFLRYFPEEVLAEIMSKPTPTQQQAADQPAKTPQTPATQQTSDQPTGTEKIRPFPVKPKTDGETSTPAGSEEPSEKTWFSKETIIFGGVMLLSIIVFFKSLVVGESRALALFNLLQIAGPCLAGMQRKYLSAFIPQKLLWMILIWITPGSWINLFLAPALLVAMLFQRDEPINWTVPPTGNGEWYRFHPLTRLGLVDISRTTWVNRRDKILEMYDQRWFRGQPSADMSTIGDVDCNATTWLTILGLRRVDVEVIKKGSNQTLSLICAKAQGESITKSLQDLRDWTCDQRGIARYRHS